MDDESTSASPNPYTKTGLIVAATLLPALGWALKQVFQGAKKSLASLDDVNIDQD